MRSGIVSCGLAALALLCSSPDLRADAPSSEIDRTAAVPTPYDQLLKDHLRETALPDGGVDVRFDYGALRAREDGAALRKTIRDAFQSVNPASLTEAEQVAWAVNCYNFFVIDLVTEHFVSAKGDTLRSIRDIAPQVFDDDRIRVGGRAYSLNAFERAYLFAGERPDPRLHFALVCAATGCPPLAAAAFEAGTLDTQLDAATRSALQNPRHLRATDSPARLEVSKIFEWYRKDFGTDEEMRYFLARYAPARLARGLGDPRLPIEPSLEWDWRLNRP